jgi:hypothetical protein
MPIKAHTMRVHPRFATLFAGASRPFTVRYTVRIALARAFTRS